MSKDLNNRAPELVEHFFRREYGRTVSALARRFGARRIELIEDSVQNAMAAALKTWAKHGVPENAGAWLTRAAHNSVIDNLRRQKIANGATDDVVATVQRLSTGPDSSDEEILDDELRMLFICCDDGLKRETQLVLALKFLCGFSIKEIALRLFSNEETIRKRVTRGREQFRQLSSELESPDVDGMKSRVGSVQQVVYLLFNEGYSSSRADEPIRRELCTEAIRLGKLLCEHEVATSESWALLALMHFHHARINARTDAEGGLLFLEDQDRRLWDKREIHIGMGCLMKSETARPSRYHIEAAILLEHLSASSFDETNWEDIAAMYVALDKVNPSPLNTLNQAIALAEWKGAAEGLKLLESVTPPTWLTSYYLWDATLGELNRRAGHTDTARKYLTRALQSAPTNSERARIQGWLDRCD